MNASESFQITKTRLAQQASLGTVDAFEKATRRVTAQAIARALRATAGQPGYTIKDIDPAIVERIAREVEKFYE